MVGDVFLFHKMMIPFYGFVILGFAYFFLSRRRFDFTSVAFLGAVAYCGSGFFGTVATPIDVRFIMIPLETETYALMTTVVALTLFAGLIRSSFVPIRGPIIQPPATTFALHILAGGAAVGVLMTAGTVGNALFAATKQELVENLGGWWLLWGTCAMLLTACAHAGGQKLYFWFGIGNLALLLFAGARGPFILSMLAVGTMWLHGQAPQLLCRHWRTIALGIVAVIAAVLAKHLIQPLRIAVTGDGMEQMISVLYNLDIARALMIPEPWGLGRVANEIIRTRFTVDPAYLWEGIWAQFSMLSILHPGKTPDFNAQYQHALFPQVDAGMASFFFVEGWAIGGWTGVLSYAALWLIGIVLFSRLLCLRDPFLRGAGSVMGAYWCFYIHRNNLITQISSERRLLLVAGVALLIGMFLGLIKRSRRASSEQGSKPAAGVR